MVCSRSRRWLGLQSATSCNGCPVRPHLHCTTDYTNHRAGAGSGSRGIWVAGPSWPWCLLVFKAPSCSVLGAVEAAWAPSRRRAATAREHYPKKKRRVDWVHSKEIAKLNCCCEVTSNRGGDRVQREANHPACRTCPKRHTGFLPCNVSHAASSASHLVRATRHALRPGPAPPL